MRRLSDGFREGHKTARGRERNARTTRSVEVSFRDLDLSTQSGAAKLYRRIQAAARNVCQYEPTSPRVQIIWQYCVLPTVDAAVANVNSPLLTELHSGHSSPAVTAMNK